MEIINYEEKEMIPLTDEETKSYETQKVCHYCEKRITNKGLLIKRIKRHLNYSIKIEIIVIIPESLEELLIVFAL